MVQPILFVMLASKKIRIQVLEWRKSGPYKHMKFASNFQIHFNRLKCHVVFYRIIVDGFARPYLKCLRQREFDRLEHSVRIAPEEDSHVLCLVSHEDI